MTPSPPIERVTEATLTESGLALLKNDECLRLLRTVNIGRVVVTTGGAAIVLPVNYVMVGSDVMFFTGEGVKLNAAFSRSTVTFQADQIDVAERSGWSVMAVGTASAAPYGARARVESLGLYPWAAGDRHHLVRIRPNFLSGRRILSGHETQGRG